MEQIATPEEFLATGSKRALAELLGTSLKGLCFQLHGPGLRYERLEIPKRSGGTRLLLAPNKGLKYLQRRLVSILSECYRPRHCVHGFVRGKSIRTNAERHCRKKFVFNIDLLDFFPSINFGRVRGLFLAKPFDLPEEVATTLAQICCFEGTLPQGAPTSPIISNFVCSRMDGALQRLAKKSNCWYSRFADDLTFSTDYHTFPRGIAIFEPPNPATPGEELSEIIQSNGFIINSGKTRMQVNCRRQQVTGIVVNRHPNIRRSYYRSLRAAVHCWEHLGIEEAAARFSAKFNTTKAPVVPPKRFKKIVRGRIEFLGMVRGKSDRLYLMLCDKYHDLANELVTTLPMSPLRRLRDDFEKQKLWSKNHQKRGKILESFFRRLFAISKLRATREFTRSKGGEQIDGGFKLGNIPFIVECKWLKDPNPRDEMNVFVAKVGDSGGMTMGLFVSISGFSKHCVPALTRSNDYASQRIILMDGEEFEAVLYGHISFTTLIEEKLDHLNLDGNPFYPASEILEKGSRLS